MAKRRPKQKPEKRTDAERRARQCERFSRLLRVLHYIMGPGRWDAEALARELEVSPRTIHRLMQTLSMANVPWYFCKESECYRVRPGFKFPGMESLDKDKGQTLSSGDISFAAGQLLTESKRLIESLDAFSKALEKSLEGPGN